MAGGGQEEEGFAGIENRCNAMHKLVGWGTNLQGCGASRLVSQELDGEFGPAMQLALCSGWSFGGKKDARRTRDAFGESKSQLRGTYPALSLVHSS